MIFLDEIAKRYTTENDRSYNPMRWKARWSDGRNLPLGLQVPDWPRNVIPISDWYPPGLWLISSEGHGHLVKGIGAQADGVKVTAWTRQEAEARLRAIVEKARV